MQSDNYKHKYYKYKTKYLNLVKVYEMRGGATTASDDDSSLIKYWYNSKYITLSYYAEIRWTIIHNRLDNSLFMDEDKEFRQTFTYTPPKKIFLFSSLPSKSTIDIIKELYIIDNNIYTLKPMKYILSKKKITSEEPYINKKKYLKLEQKIKDALNKIFLFCKSTDISLPYWKTNKFQTFYFNIEDSKYSKLGTELFPYKELYTVVSFRINNIVYKYYKLKKKILDDIISRYDFNILNENDKDKYIEYEKEICIKSGIISLCAKNYILRCVDTDKISSFYDITEYKTLEEIPKSIQDNFTQDADKFVYNVLFEARQKIMIKDNINKSEFGLLSENQQKSIKSKLALKQQEQQQQQAKILEQQTNILEKNIYDISVDDFNKLSEDQKKKVRDKIILLKQITYNLFQLLLPLERTPDIIKRVQEFIMIITNRGDSIDYEQYELLPEYHKTFFKFDKEKYKRIKI